METEPMSEAEGNLSPNWLELPRDVTAAILKTLGFIDILKKAQRVCTQWRSICKEPSMWSTIHMENLGSLLDLDLESFANMFRQAVDRSCGGLIYLNMGLFGSNEHLCYAAQRCTQIRRLRFVFSNITNEGICEATKRLPLLEDLEISYCNGFAEALQKFDEYCPLLKSLKFNQRGRRNSSVDDSEAMSIAKNMPELRRLQLFGNRLSNKGLEAILDGCPHLESLDLRLCFNINLVEGSSLEERCGARINDFRGPLDSTDDYEFKAIAYDASSECSDFDALSEPEDYDNYLFSGGEESYDNYHDW